MTDEDGDRLNGATSCHVDVNLESSSGSMHLIEYNEKTKTATFIRTYNLSPSETIGEKITFTLSHLRTSGPVHPWKEPYLEDRNPWRTSYLQDSIDPYQVVKDHTAETKKTRFYERYDAFHLKGNQLDIPLEGFLENWVHFSNASFIDGKLHLQVANKDGTEAAWPHSIVYTLYLVDKNGNEIGSEATGRLPEETDEIRVLSFSEGPWTFREFLFPKIYSSDDLKGIKLVAEGQNYSYRSDEIWQTTFTLPADEESIAIPVEKEMILGRTKVNAHQITISPLNVRVYYDEFDLPDGGWYSAFYGDESADEEFPKNEVFITYKDGTQVVLDWSGLESDSTSAGNLAAERFSMPFASSFAVIELEKVNKITISGQEFSLVSP